MRGRPLMRALTVRHPDPAELWRRLYDEHRVEVPAYEWEDTTLMRVSIGPYNDDADLERLVDAMRAFSDPGSAVQLCTPPTRTGKTSRVIQAAIQTLSTGTTSDGKRRAR